MLTWSALFKPLFLFVVLAAVLPSTSHAASLQPGDLLVVDASAFANGGIIKVDPFTGLQTLISPGTGRNSIAIDQNGDFLVVDQNPVNGVIRVNHATGASASISSGGLFVSPHGVTTDNTGEIFVTDLGSGIIKIDPNTGGQALVSSGGFLSGATNLAVEDDGDLLVVTGAFGGAVHGIVRVDRLTGNQTILSSGGLFHRPHDIAIDPGGRAIVVDFDAGVVRVDTATGAQGIVSSGGNFCFPAGIAVSETGDILVADACGAGAIPFGGIIRITPATGVQTVVSSGGLFNDPSDVAVFPQLAILVQIDIKPGAFPNTINLKSHGTVPVAVLGTSQFDVRTVNPASVKLGGAPVKQDGPGCPISSLQDVNGDGLLDLVVHVNADELQLSQEDTHAMLEGRLFDGRAIKGSDSIRIVP